MAIEIRVLYVGEQEAAAKNFSEYCEGERDNFARAGEIVGEIYDAFAKQYIKLSDERTLHSLNVLCVRLVFCLYDVSLRKAQKGSRR